MDQNRSNTATLSKGLLIGIGNPLLDISAIVEHDLLEKYGMKPNDAIMGEEKHMPLYRELADKYDVEYIAGGSSQNSLRVVQWLLKSPQVTTYFGCVGDDDFGRILREKATSDGVNVQYQVDKELPTGTCAVLVTGVNRSLCANLAAANNFTADHLTKPDNLDLIKSAKYFYSTGFFIAVSPKSLMQLAQHAETNNHHFMLNLSAPFVSQFFKDDLEKLMPYVDVLFGNEAESEAFAKAFDIKETDIQTIAEKIADMPKINKNRSRVVVITQGCDPVILVENDTTTLIPVEKLSREEIVDTNGAGDAFAGGFLSQLILGEPFTTCVKCGIYAATHIIKHSGCTFSGESQFFK